MMQCLEKIMKEQKVIEERIKTIHGSPEDQSDNIIEIYKSDNEVKTSIGTLHQGMQDTVTQLAEYAPPDRQRNWNELISHLNPKNWGQLTRDDVNDYASYLGGFFAVPGFAIGTGISVASYLISK